MFFGRSADESCIEREKCRRGYLRKLSAIRALIFWAAFTSVLHAQQYVFRTYRQPEGLKNLAVKGMVKDRTGFLWLGTENGVYRFLGTGFQRFGSDEGIAELDVKDIVSDPNGTVWVGTDENVYRWDGNRFQPAGTKPIAVNDSQQMAVEDASHLLLIEHGLLYRLEHDRSGKMLSFSQVIPDAILQARPELSRAESVAVVEEKSGSLRIWLGCGKHLYSMPGGNSTLESSKISLWGRQQGLEEDNWLGILLDHSGTLWAGGRSHIAVLPRGGAHFEDRTIPGSRLDSVYRFAPFLEDPQGRVLVGAKEGVARWEGTHWRSIGGPNGLQRTSQVAGMAIDAEGDLWLGSRGNGLVGWTGYESWEGWSTDQGIPSPVIWAIAPGHDGRVVVGAEHGLASIDVQSGEVHPVSGNAQWNHGQISATERLRDGSLLVGTFSGEVLRFDARSGQGQVTARLGDYVMNMLEDKAGKIYFSTKRGIYVRPAGNLQAAPQLVAEADALLGNSRRIEASCVSPEGSLWFLSRNRLLREKDGNWSRPPIEGLPALRGTLLSLSCSADGAVWITGDQTETWRLAANGNRVEANQLPIPNEFRTLTPLSILADHRGWVWLGTDLGVLVWNQKSWRHLTQESGLIWNDINQNTLREAPDGSLWVGTSNGVAHLIHPERVFDSAPLSVSVTGIRRGRTLDASELRISLPWSKLPLGFQLSSPNMRNRSELVFGYRLLGQQAEWTENQDGLAVFTSLPPGEYVLEAQAQNADLGSRSDVVQVAVHILAPWWRTNWFLGLCTLAFLLLLYAINRLYAKHLRERSTRLEALVLERTRELEMSREQLRIQATHDGLTGMLNRGAVLRSLGMALERARRENRTLVVALVDLDHFKVINDTYGHFAGDAALRWFAAAVGAAIRPYDYAGRYGGEEFLLVLSEIPRNAVESRLASLHAAITNLKVQEKGREFPVNCSIGATVLDPTAGTATAELLLTIADQALYEAKAQGRNRVVFYHAHDPVPISIARSGHDRHDS